MSSFSGNAWTSMYRSDCSREKDEKAKRCCHRVFVYGSLKKAYGNNRFLRDSEYLGEAVTTKAEFNMVNLGAFPAVAHNGNHQVKGELYLIDDDTLKSLDALESNGSLYQRQEISILGHDKPAWMYLFMWDISECAPDMMSDIANSGNNIQEWKGGIQLPQW